MKNIYFLQIDVETYAEVLSIDKILGVEHNTSNYWEFRIEENLERIDYINLFLNILEERYEALEQIGVTRDMISIWRYYVYDEQCNFEFSPIDLKRLGDNGITLCLSCWDSGEEYDHDAVFEKVLN